MAWSFSKLLEALMIRQSRAHRKTRRRDRNRARPLLEGLEDRLAPAAFVVTSLGDSNTSGTLRNAINNLTSGGNSITFAPSLIGATIVLTNGPLVINHSVSITGPGADELAISGGKSSRIFTIPAAEVSTGPVQISGLTLDNGAASFGGAISNAANLTLTADVLSNNTAQGYNGAKGSAGGGGGGGLGGAIYNSGSLNVQASTLSGNLAAGGNGGHGYTNLKYNGLGGGAGAYGSSSGALGGAGGGGNAGNSSHKSGYNGQSPGGGGGGGASFSGYGGNGGNGGFGGGAGGGAPGTTHYGVGGNPPAFGTYGGQGGNAGMYFYDNYTRHIPASGSGGGGAGLGGAICNHGGSVTITNSTVAGNTAQAGFTSFGYHLGNSGGNIYSSGSNGAADGGGIFSDTSLLITSCTFANNTAGVGGGVFNAKSGTAFLTSSIIAQNTGTNPDVSGTFTAQAHNLIGNPTGGSGIGGTDFTGINPLLLSLGNYGGATPTMALAAGSPALNNGAQAPGFTVDQRGALRGAVSGLSGLDAGSVPDIGAYEASSSYLVTSSADTAAAGTLRGGIEWANVNINPLTLNQTPNTIVFNTSGAFATPQTISLTVTGNTFDGPSALAVTGNVAIDGPTGSGQGVTITRSSSVADLRLFNVSSTGSLTLSALTLTGGTALGYAGAGGAAGGGGAAGLGGAIFNQGTLNLVASTLTGNLAAGGSGGYAKASGSGGTGGGGGGLLGPGYLEYGGTGGGGNGAYTRQYGYSGGFGGGGGGAGYNFPTNNSGGTGGNGGFGGGGGGSTFGQAPGTSPFGGGSGGRSNGLVTGGGGGGAGLGGAIFNQLGTVTVTDSTLTANTAQGAAGGGASGGKYPGAAGAGLGGAIFNHSGSITITNSTVAANTADQGGSVYDLGDAAAGSVTLVNSILANSAHGASDFQSATINSGTIVTVGDSNLVRTNAGTGGFVGGGTLTGHDPLLGALASNGGPTPTMALLAGSPALDSGDNFAVTAPAFPSTPYTDQRGLPRISNGTVDLGAFEYQAAPATPAVFVPASATAGVPFLVTVQEISTFSGTVTLTSTDPNVPTLPSVTVLRGIGSGLATLETVPGSPWTITAAAGAATATSTPVPVTPGPAAKLAFGVQPASTVTGNVLNPAVTVQILDDMGNVVTSDNTDQVTIGIASGPGSFTAGSTTTVTVHNGVATFSNLTLVQPGSYTLSAVVPALYTGPNSNVFNVIPLQVVAGSFAGSPSGFTLQFNTQYLVNSVTPVLYGQGFGASAPVPSVTVSQTKDAAGHAITPIPVTGSLVLNTATNTITFVATNTSLEVNNGSPLLPDGTYTVVLHSSAATDGFQALNSGGGFLDGKGTGIPGSGDFTTTFVVNAAAQDALWIPDVAEGPGQTLNAPGANRAGGGYPLYLKASAANVTSLQVTLNYNPALLTVTGVTGTGGGSGFSLGSSSTPGMAILKYSGPALAAGSATPVGFITATVPSGTTASSMPYKAKDLLHLSSPVLNGGSIAVTTSDALHLVAYVADADGNGSYSSNDAVLITRVALQVDSGFTAYPLVDPVIVADTDGSGFIPADAALQANEASVGFPAANLASPPIPSGVHFVPIANNVDPSLSLQESEVRGQGAERIVTVAVNIDDADPAGSTGLLRGNLALRYDPRLFQVTAADVHLGSVLAAGSGWTVTPTIDPVTGQIAIALSSTTPITSTIGGSLVTIDLHPLTPESSPLTPVMLVSSVNPTGPQVIFTELEDAQGTFTLTPAPSNGFPPRIGSLVTLAAPPPALTNPEVIESVTNNAAAPAQVQGLETGTQTEGVVVNTAAPESGGEAINPAGAEVVHMGVARSALATASFSLLPTSGVALAGPLTAFPYVSAINPPEGFIAAQRLAEQFFRSVVPGPNADLFERAPASPIQASFTAECLDSLTWHDLGEDLDLQDVGALLREQGKRRESRQAAVQENAAYQSVLDQCFSQTANDLAMAADEE